MLDDVPVHALILLTAFGGAVATVPAARRLAERLGVVDQPGDRKLHVTPTPLLGGLAIYLAVVLALLVLLERQAWQQVLGILAGGTLLLLVGFADDAGLLPAQLKLAGAMPVAALLLIASGIRTVYPLRLVAEGESWLLDAVALGITLLWIVGITAAFSILDHMDGLCAGIAAIAAGFFYGLALTAGQSWVSVLAIALVGAALGFLVWNFNPAKIFMGDGGAMFLGFTVAALGVKLNLADHPPTQTWMVPVLVLGVPILDTGLVIVSRLRRGLVPMKAPGKDHLAHRLANLGLGQRGAALALYGAGLMSGAVACLTVWVEPEVSVLLFAGAVLMGAVIIALMERAPFERQEADLADS